MTMTAPISVPMIPESAPFSPSQRAWLNGFFAGLLSKQGAGALPESPVQPQTATEEESFPWHDASLELDERMKLAEGRPLERVLMAAMAQLDCGTCGYVCKTYAEAIARGEDKELTKCTPGGKATARKLKEIMSGQVPVSAPAVEVKVNGHAVPSAPKTHSRSNPFPAKLLLNQKLTGAGSAKDVRLIGFDLADSGLTYNVGDSLGVYAENCPETIVALLKLLGFDGTETAGIGQGRSASLFEAMLKHYSITQASESLVRALAEAATDEKEKLLLLQMLEDDGPGVPEGIEILDLLEMHPSARPSVEIFASSLSSLQPRLYSISSSLKATPAQVHLTVGCVRYQNTRGRSCRGVVSTYLAERLTGSRTARIFVQPAHGFALPKDPNVSIIMIGPGTGVAPFRAFLQERLAVGAKGRNWLFFGDQTSEHDFLYRDELTAMQHSGLLTRLDLAFSRDQKEKIYVQHRMAEHAGALWSWLEDGAHFYVCGDAKRMAKDVDQTLKQIVAEQGGMTPDAAAAYVKELSNTGRYQRDVY